jgi:hypothetical protein
MPSARKQRSEFLTVIVATLVVASIIAGVTALLVRHALRTQAGDPKAGFVVRAAGRSVVVLADRVGAGRRRSTATGTRVTALDGASGQRLALRVLDDWTECWPGARGRLWCRDDRGGLARLEPATLRTTGPGDERAAQVEEGAPAGADASEVRGRGAASTSRCRTTPAHRLLDTGDPSVALVLSDRAGEPNGTAVSRLDASGRRLWSSALGGPCQHVEVVDGLLLVATSNPAQRARAIDVATGEVRWAFGFAD